MKYLGKRRMYKLASELFRCDDTSTYFTTCVESSYKKCNGMEWLITFGQENKYILCADKYGAYLSIEVYDNTDRKTVRKVLNGFGKQTVNIDNV